MNRVVERRLAYWPDKQTRAEAARLFAGGMELGEVLARYPDEVITRYRNEAPRGAARRVLWAMYALTQESVGEPDVDPYDYETIKAIDAEKGIVVARCRTGHGLGWYSNEWPPLSWCLRQAPSDWPR